MQNDVETYFEQTVIPLIALFSLDSIASYGIIGNGRVSVALGDGCEDHVSQETWMRVSVLTRVPMDLAISLRLEGSKE
jgi:hypothetical protein